LRTAKLIILLICAGITLKAHAQTEIDIATRTRGSLPASRIVPGVNGQCLTTVNGNSIWATCAAGGAGYSTIQNAAVAIAQRATLNWLANIVCVDNTGASRSDCNLAPTISTATINATTGFQVNGAASAGKVLIGDGSNFVPGDPLVQGLFADGSTSIGNPVVTGGYDAAGTPAIHRSIMLNGSPAGTEYGLVTRPIPSGTQTVSGSISISNFPATQPVSASALPLPSGAATSAKQPALGTAGSSSADVLSVQGIAGGTALKTDSSAVTQPVSAASLPLPSGAATSTKQPALGTAGTPSADVITVQGASSMTALKVDGSASTQPISGTVTANAGSGTMAVSAASLPLPTGAAQDSTLTAGTAKAITRGGAKGTTTAADLTSTASGANHQPLDTAIYDASGNQLGLSATPLRTDPTGTTTQPVSGTVSLTSGQQIKPTDGTNIITVKAASTASVATDTSQVVQISPNQPQLTTPLNVQGGKTNNNAAPGATNVGTLPGVGNAAPPTYTEGNQAALSMDLAGNLRVYGHPPNVLGCYTVNGRTGTYTGLTAGAILFSMRNSSSTVLEIIQRVKVNVITSTAATTAGEAERELHVVRSFTASDTGGTAVTLTGNNAKMRTSQATSTVGDMRFGQPLTAGTGTADANPVSSVVAWLPLNFTGVDVGCGGAGATGAVWSCAGGIGPIDLLNATNGQEYPIVLAQNEGIRITIGKDAMPAAAVQQTTVTVEWCEVSSY
jgi:hypothetical protein